MLHRKSAYFWVNLGVKLVSCTLTVFKMNSICMLHCGGGMLAIHHQAILFFSPPEEIVRWHAHQHIKSGAKSTFDKLSSFLTWLVICFVFSPSPFTYLVSSVEIMYFECARMQLHMLRSLYLFANPVGHVFFQNFHSGKVLIKNISTDNQVLHGRKRLREK